MTRYREKRINKILTIAIIILTVFILICGYQLKLIREEEQRSLAQIKLRLEEKENNVAEVIYNKEVFGTDFDLENIDDYILLDEYEGLKFMRLDGTYFVLNDEGTLNCEYLFNEERNSYNYRYCDVKINETDSVRIDFANLKFETE